MHKTTEKKITTRPPIVAIMGHIDHGKSTLLDYIRKANIVAGEAGGITQHLGAYEVVHKDKSAKEHRLTFLDTPGHEAFCGIRERGAKVADIGVLVVSAEDGVKPQTVEALKCYLECETPYIVAINKIDKPNIDIEKTKQNLAENEIYLEGYGGTVPWVAISALNGKGVDELLDTIVLLAELEEIKCDLSKKAEGYIIETNVDSRKGITATIVITDGSLKLGQFIVAETSYCPIRNIEKSDGKQAKEAFCGSPARILGWNSLPPAGSEFFTVSSKVEAEKIASHNLEILTTEKKSAGLKNNENNEGKCLIPLLIKADTAGSMEAIIHEIEKVKVENILVKIISAGSGTISESDIKLASTARNSTILGFNVKIDSQAKSASERLNIPILTFDIIYRLGEWLQNESLARKPKIETEEQTGKAKIIKIFGAEKDKYVIGGRVELGTIVNGAQIKLLRRDAEIGKGKIRSLQQLKQKIEEAKKDTEFGALIESKIEPAPGDRIESYIIVTK